ITVARPQPGRFSDAEVTLVQTFADQAVIAIENVRLFKELESRNAALTETLDQQTATSEILRVISSSPTDVQPTVEAIAKRARTLCDAAHAMVFRFDGELIHLVAHDNLTPDQHEAVRAVFPIPPGRQSVTARAILSGELVHVRDRRDDPELDYRILTENFPTTLAVPLVRDRVTLGAITVTRAEAQSFSQREIDLLETFADQAVIAIENVRLFKELEARNRDLTTALDKQTATSDILCVISQSQTDVQPVFDAILASAVRLLGAYSGVLTRIAGDQIVLATLTSTDDAGDAATRALFPQALQSELSKTGQWDKMAVGYAQVIGERAPLNIADVHTDPRWPETARVYARLRGYRSWAAVPMILRNEAIGTISVTRSGAGGFTDDEI